MHTELLSDNLLKYMNTIEQQSIWVQTSLPMRKQELWSFHNYVRYRLQNDATGNVWPLIWDGMSHVITASNSKQNRLSTFISRKLKTID